MRQAGFKLGAQMYLNLMPCPALGNRGVKSLIRHPKPELLLSQERADLWTGIPLVFSWNNRKCLLRSFIIRMCLNPGLVNLSNFSVSIGIQFCASMAMSWWNIHWFEDGHEPSLWFSRRALIKGCNPLLVLRVEACPWKMRTAGLPRVMRWNMLSHFYHQECNMRFKRSLWRKLKMDM